MASDNEGDAEQTISINEYLNEVEQVELEADMVLGGDEGKECTYSKGYMKRQAIFSCLTCTPEGNAGVCTACSLSCHDGHEIVELWTKRNFRCDCGNSKFGEFFCKLSPSKDVENAENSYNHNFKGIYCTCNRPYPDPDAEEQEEMIQCCMCEDWFHEEHLGLESSEEIPRDEEGEPLYEDFICKACAASCSFLALYPQKIRAQCNATANSNKDKNVLEDIPSDCGSGKLEIGTSSGNPPKKDDVISIATSESVSSGKEPVNGGSSEEKGKNDASLNSSCLLGETLVAASPPLEFKPLFLSKNWRDTLCKCENCLVTYKQKGISYLLDKEYSITEYERSAKQKREEKLQQRDGAELSLLNNLGHVQKIEILNGIEDLKDEFCSFLESFDPAKAITSDDIHQIFENLAKKRKRTD